MVLVVGLVSCQTVSCHTYKLFLGLAFMHFLEEAKKTKISRNILTKEIFNFESREAYIYTGSQKNMCWHCNVLLLLIQVVRST